MSPFACVVCERQISDINNLTKLHVYQMSNHAERLIIINALYKSEFALEFIALISNIARNRRDNVDLHTNLLF